MNLVLLFSLFLESNQLFASSIDAEFERLIGIDIKYRRNSNSDDSLAK